MENTEQPIRVQRKRTKGYKLPTNTISVTRPGRWGNPFTVEGELSNTSNDWAKFGLDNPHLIRIAAQKQAVSRFESALHFPENVDMDVEEYNAISYIRNNIGELRGKNLVCFCAPGTPCHADVLLALANSTQP